MAKSRGTQGREQNPVGTRPGNGRCEPGQLPQEVLLRVARTLKAVAHPLRLRIVEVLEGGERTVGEIVEATGAKPAITSQQLGLMRDRGVLSARRDGLHVYYRIANRHVVQVIHCIRRSCEVADA